MDEAARWRVRMDQGFTGSQAVEFDRWLADPVHAEAFDKVSQAWDVTADADAPDVLALRARVRGGLRRKQAQTVWLRMAASFAVMAGGGGLYFAQAGQVFENAHAQPRSVVLSDGSRLMLDEGARVRVRYGAGERRLTLEAGQASFEVAHNPQRPFRVKAGDMIVTARGTVFNVDSWSHGATVALLQGKVDVAEGGGWLSGPNQQTQLTPGQSVSIENGQLLKTVSIEAGAATAWRQGSIVLDDVSLAEAVERVNRYGGRRVELAEPALGRLRVSGVFKGGEPTAFSQSVARLYGLRAEPVDDHILIKPSGAG